MTRVKKLTEKIEIRVSEFEKNRIQWLANQYAGGNVSLYMIWAALNTPRKKISAKSLLEYSNRK